MDAVVLYALSGAALLASVLTDRAKTLSALKKAMKSLESILPQFLVVLLVVAASLAVLDNDAISRLIGADTGFLGILGASLVGAITLIPGFVAFPAAAALLSKGAGVTQIASFLSSLMMVGIITLPLEMKYFGKKAALLRNGLAWAFSILAAFFVGWAVSA